MIDHTLKEHEIDPYERRDYTGPDDAFRSFVQNWRFYGGRCSVFLGAGSSVGARNREGSCFPTAPKLRDELWRYFMLEENRREDFDTRNLGLMSLEHVAALVEARVGRKVLLEYLERRFEASTPLWQHAVLPFLKPEAVFTTNYDNLIELGWRLHDAKSVAPLHEVFRAKGARVANRVPLFKPHGTVERAKEDICSGGLVITQFDYFNMLREHSAMLREFLSGLKEQCVLFLGYSFLDMDIGAELFQIRKEERGIHWYAVFPRDDADVRGMYRDKFSVFQINRTFFDFMCEFDDAVDFIPAAWKRQQIPMLQAQGRIQ